LGNVRHIFPGTPSVGSDELDAGRCGAPPPRKQRLLLRVDPLRQVPFVGCAIASLAPACGTQNDPDV